ncbi:MAG: SCP2 sterol-binding domain-containing protein [Acidiferrobacterales bacterium]
MHALPHLLALPLRVIPDVVHTQILAQVLSHLLRGQLLTTRLQELDGKTVCINITDGSCKLHFLIKDGRLHRAPRSQTNVYIRGRLNDFWLLATRREDPDTLFFSRRLCLEGDTETGLHIKNLLDSLEYDWDAHFRAVLGEPVASVLGRLFRHRFL